MDWFQEGKEVAEIYFDEANAAESLEDHPNEPECPWPVHTPEGADWFRGWNSVTNEQGEIGRELIGRRPQGSGWMFEPSDMEDCAR